MDILRLIGSYGRLTVNICILLRSEILGSGIEVLELVLDLDLDLDLYLDLTLDWSRDRPLRILSLRYTGFKGVILASIILRLRRP